MGKEIIKATAVTLSLTNISQTSPAELALATNCRSVQAAIAAGTPSIGEVVNTGGAEQISAFIELNITMLAKFCNLGNSIKDMQIPMTADLVMSEFGNLTIADVNLIFRRAKLGQYGEFYGRLDGQMILMWCGKYLDERCEAEAERSRVEAASRSIGRLLPSRPEMQRVQKELATLIREKKIR